MGWFRLDESFPEHPKVMGLGLRAEGLFVRGLAYACRVKTDGHIPTAFIRSMPDPDVEAVATSLVAAGLWETTPCGFLIHDYLDYQPSREDLKQRTEVFRESGRRGGTRSGIVRRESPAKPGLEAYPSSLPLKPGLEAHDDKGLKHITEHNSTEHIATHVAMGTTSQAKSKTKVQTRATRVPDDFSVTDAMRTYAGTKGVAADAVDRETERFLDHHRAKGTTMLDWVAGWRNWMARSLDYAPRRSNGSTAVSRGDRARESHEALIRQIEDEERATR